MVKTADPIIENVQLPTLPAVAAALIQHCANSEATIQEIAKTIEADPALAIRLLRVANSAYYGLRHKVSTVERAAITLGIKYLKSVALAFNFVGTFKNVSGRAFNQETFWRDSLLRGCLARRLAAEDCPEVREEAFLVGLLQDIGIPVLAGHLGGPYIRLLNEAHGCRLRLYLEENRRFGTNHVHVAKRICEAWKIPGILAKPIVRHHARPGSAPSEDHQTKLWQYAYFVAAIPFGDRVEDEPIDSALRASAKHSFGLELEALTQVFDQTCVEFEALRTLFEEALPPDCSPEALLQRAANMFNDMGLGLPPGLE